MLNPNSANWSGIETVNNFNYVLGTGKYGIIFLKKHIFIFKFLLHNSHDKFDRQKLVSNQMNKIELWKKCWCRAWVLKRVCHHQAQTHSPGTAYQWSKLSAKTTRLSSVPSTVVRTWHTIKRYQFEASWFFVEKVNKSQTDSIRSGQLVKYIKR